MSQMTTVLKMLAQGRTVSKLTAVHLGIGNIHDVVMRLRREDWTIVTKKDVDGKGRKFTKYVLPTYERKLARIALDIMEEHEKRR